MAKIAAVVQLSEIDRNQLEKWVRAQFTPQQVVLRSSMDLPRGVTLDAALRWVDTVWINNGPTGGAVVGIVPSYFGLDSRLAWKVSRTLELSVTGQNLLHDHHPEYGYPSPTREEIVRSVFARITWGY